MANKEKKIKKLKERITSLKDEMFQNLKQKTSSTAEISISGYQTKIAEAEKQLAALIA